MKNELPREYIAEWKNLFPKLSVPQNIFLLATAIVAATEEYSASQKPYRIAIQKNLLIESYDYRKIGDAYCVFHDFWKLLSRLHDDLKRYDATPVLTLLRSKVDKTLFLAEKEHEYWRKLCNRLYDFLDEFYATSPGGHPSPKLPRRSNVRKIIDQYRKRSKSALN